MPGTYAVEGGKQKTLFAQGTVYFRHGAQSEPGNSDDFSAFIERSLTSIRRAWLDGIAKIVKSPAGSTIHVLPPEVMAPTLPNATAIRIVDDPSAPAYRAYAIDETHPYRLTELTRRVNQLLSPLGKQISTYHVQCIRKQHAIDDDIRYCYKQRHVSPKYSEDFAQWVLARHSADPEFFKNTLEAAT